MGNFRARPYSNEGEILVSVKTIDGEKPNVKDSFKLYNNVVIDKLISIDLRKISYQKVTLSVTGKINSNKKATTAIVRFDSAWTNYSTLRVITKKEKRESTDYFQDEISLLKTNISGKCEIKIDYLNNDNKQFQKSYEEYNKDLDKSGSRGPLDKPVVYRESKPSFPKYVLPKVEEKIEEVHNDKGDIIEGFVPGDFVSDNGPGEQHVVGCPDEYEFDPISGMCKKKVDQGRTHVDVSDYTDICHPNNYDGIDNMGHIMCSTELDVDGARLQLSTRITDQNSMNEIIREFIR